VTELRQHADEDCLIMVVGDKTDLNGMCVISRKQGLHFARKSGHAFIETSAKEGSGVRTAFERLVEEIYKVQIKKQSLIDDTSRTTLSTGGKPSDKLNSTLALDCIKNSDHHLPKESKCCSTGG
jgi:GTPase SAR1 family protein